MKKEWITIYTDVSLRKGKFAVAVWIKSSFGRDKFYYKTLHAGFNITQAEMFGIFAGIYSALTMFNNPLEGGKTAIKGIVVKCDNKNVVESFWPNKRQRTKQRLKSKRQRQTLYLFEKIEELTKDIEFRTIWVKGHQDANTVPAWLNR